MAMIAVSRKTRALIDKLKAIAMDNYENGGDGFIECYDDAEWVRFIEDAEGKPITELRKAMKLYDDHRRDIQNS